MKKSSWPAVFLTTLLFAGVYAAVALNPHSAQVTRSWMERSKGAVPAVAGYRNTATPGCEPNRDCVRVLTAPELPTIVLLDIGILFLGFRIWLGHRNKVSAARRRDAYKGAAGSL